MQRPPRIAEQILAACAIVIVAAVLRFWPFGNLGLKVPYITFYPAVTLAALYGGRIPGLVATLLSTAFVYFWQSRNNPDFEGTSSWEGMLIFAITGIIISAISEAMLRARLREAQAVAQARQEMESAETARQSERKLEASEQRLRTMFDNAPVGMVTVDPMNLRFLRANKVAQELYGYSEEELRQLSVDELTHPDDRAHTEQYNRLLTSGAKTTHSVEKRYLRRDGSSFWAEANMAAIHNAEGRLEYLLGSFVDISQRKHNECLLLQWSNAFANSALGIVLGDPATQTIIAANPSFAAMLGRDARQMTGYPILECYPAAEHDRIRRLIADVNMRGRLQYESRMTRSDGSEFPVQIDLVAVQDAEGQLLYRVATVQDISVRKAAEFALQESEQTYRSLFENMLNGFAYCQMLYAPGQKPDFTYLIVNRAFGKLTGLQDVEGKKVSEVIPGIQDSSADLLEIYSRVATSGIPEQFEYHVAALHMWFSISVYSPRRDFFVAVFDVITARKQLEDSLRKLSVAVEQNPNSIMITDLDARIVYTNAAFQQQSGFASHEVLGKNPRILQSGKTPRQDYIALGEQLSRGNVWKGEFINRRKDGSEYVVSSLISPVREEDGRITNYLAISEDVTEKKQNEARIEYLAHFDHLTGLPNRTQLEDHFKYALSLAQRSSENMAVLFLDLDHFKNINDTLGHSVGDHLLMETSRRLKAVLRDEDTISRLGGDEFIFILPGTDANGAVHVVEKLLETVSAPCQIEGHELITTSSVGIAIYPDDGRDMETLSKNADAAMYQVKQAGRNGYRFFTQAMQANSARNLQLSNALRQALRNKQLTLHYQPQVSMQDGHIVGAEALLRWTHPELGSIPPSEFITLAEESGLIIEIGEWVLRTAALQLRAWMDQGLPHMVMAVNLSAVQFRQANLPQIISGILEQTGLPPGSLELELTEAVAMDEPLTAVAVMDRLHEHGVLMSIDDFGTGYSSLSYLKRFKAYKLKIDQSFVRDIGDDPDDKAIVSAIINLASSLDMRTIAEGVETSSQLAFLRLQGCDEAQGYYFSKPLPAAEFEHYVRQTAATA